MPQRSLWPTLRDHLIALTESVVGHDYRYPHLEP
jgi:hypothetical protein